MKIDEHLLKFPKYLPNDLEGFMFYYPWKFPLIVPYFEEVAQKIGADPKAYQEYGNWAKEELEAGFGKIKKDYENGDQTNLEFLVDTDQRIHKLFCYRFWVVNYLFADGPLHDFYVDNLKNLVRKFIDVEEDVEEFEQKILKIQRDLLQSDYADLYLMQALNGVELVKLLKENTRTKKLLEEAIKLIDLHSHEKTARINELWSKVASIVQDKSDPENKLLLEKLEIPLGQVQMRGTMLPLYNMLTHAVEFRDENEMLMKRHEEMKIRIQNLLDEAREKLSDEDYEMLELSYKQAKNFSMYKDIIGHLDGDLLPLWFGIHKQIKEVLASQGKEFPNRDSGHATLFYSLVWYLPDELKAKVFTMDKTPYSLETL